MYGLVVLVIVSFLLGGCEEMLPPRIEPSDVLATDLEVPSAAITVRLGLGNVAGGGSAFAHIRVQNRHDEVLEDSAFVNGIIYARLRDDPKVSFTVLVGEGNVAGPVQVRGGRITLEPLDVFRLRVILPYTTDDGLYHWNHVGRSWLTDANGDRYFRSDPIHFLADASIQIFEKVQSKKTRQVSFSLVYNVYPFGQ